MHNMIDTCILCVYRGVLYWTLYKLVHQWSVTHIKLMIGS